MAARRVAVAEHRHPDRPRRKDRLDVEADDVAVGTHEVLQVGLDDAHAAGAQFVDVAAHDRGVPRERGGVPEGREPLAGDPGMVRRPAEHEADLAMTEQRQPARVPGLERRRHLVLERPQLAGLDHGALTRAAAPSRTRRISSISSASTTSGGITSRVSCLLFAHTTSRPPSIASSMNR